MGLTVCFKGTADQQKKAKGQFEQHNRVTITNYDENTGCALKAMANDPLDRHSSLVAKLVNSEIVTVNFSFGRIGGLAGDERGSGRDPSTGTIMIDLTDIGMSYGVTPNIGMGCSTRPGAVYSQEMIWLHETSHPATLYFGETLRPRETVMSEEHRYQDRNRKPRRHPRCHIR